MKMVDDKVFARILSYIEFHALGGDNLKTDTTHSPFDQEVLGIAEQLQLPEDVGALVHCYWRECH